MASSMTARMKDGLNRNQPAYWDARFAEAGYAYGTDANDFLVAVAPDLPRGDALCLCEGEGRNACYLAALGFTATAVDFSSVALEKASALATARGLRLKTHCADLDGFDPGVSCWDLVTVIFGQPEAGVRRALYARIHACLRPGGAFVLETKAEADADANSRYPGFAVLCAELVGMEFTIAREGSRLLKEGRYHDGEQYTAQIAAFKKL